MTYQQLSALSAGEFGRPGFDAQQFYGWANDTVETATVQADDPSNTEDDWVMVADFKRGASEPGGPPFGLLLCDLARRGLVPEGHYLVMICW